MDDMECRFEAIQTIAVRNSAAGWSVALGPTDRYRARLDWGSLGFSIATQV